MCKYLCHFKDFGPKLDIFRLVTLVGSEYNSYENHNDEVPIYNLCLYLPLLCT